jgi:two-component system CheB/CheR fusion protein
VPARKSNQQNQHEQGDGSHGGPPPGGSSERDQLDRAAQPVDDEAPPRLPFPVIGIGASAGGLEAFLEFFKVLRADTGMAFVLVQHLPPDRESMVADILSKRTAMPVLQVEDGMPVQPNHVYVIRPGRTMTIQDGLLRLGEPLEKAGHRRPVDDFFRSLAEEQRERAIGVILSGMGSNGSAGAQVIKAVGGVCIAQDPDSAKFPSMPRSLIDAQLADFILRPDQIPEVLQQYAAHPYAQGRSATELSIKQDRNAITEILTLLRTRSRRNFEGYKQPTVLRRIQRRMGLHQLTELNGYAKLLRQNPSEATALADDLVIHVTGFFRDREAWESLRTRVIEPLVAEREEHSSIRVWVTACSSGEEAYTLGMLLLEAAEAKQKTFDIKIFATDLADRMLAQARMGVYPQGIEGEITSERLERFFEKVDAVYRVRKELRELIVFSAQNILQDPPFSRLDICTCRNLLIYLEPAVQRRVMSLLHFGLREGGTLFLGNSETVNGADDLFDPVDKKWRIFRRIGITRPGEFAFPPVTTGRRQLAANEVEHGGTGGSVRSVPRASLAHVAQRTLLERFTPAAVVVDSQHRVAYFHGDTSPYLSQPAGEPTREVLQMAREGVRGALRIALHKSMAEQTSSEVRDGYIETTSGRVRVAVTVAPLDDNSLPGFFLVSFAQWVAPQALVGANGNGNGSGADGNGDGERQLMLELHRVRDELQSTVEELQTSNEELKASNEEVTSVNEELQSTNEELETSKEELQSMNEELTTVNAQLQAKMEELEATTNDLSSLLSSTDIAVVFLDTRFRIRRFTPIVRDLFELIPSDMGRPLSDLSPKFSDPDLLRDAEAVLARLVPIEREVQSTSGQWYMRRVLPYRTTDNRIEGVVVTFVDITRRREAEQRQREGEERYRLIVQSVKEYAIFLMDPDGRITMWSAGAEHVLGFTEAEAMGQAGAFIFTPEDRAAGAPKDELAGAALHGQSLDERWHLRKGGERFWGSGAVTALYNDRRELTGFVKVMRDNTDRKRAEQTLQQAHATAEAANEAKDQFLATASHELRTPLSAILLWTQMIKNGTITPESFQEGIAAIEHSALAQKQLIDDLLDTSRISSGKLRLNIRPTDLASVARLAVEAIRPSAAASGVTVNLSVPDDAGFVLADPDRLQQVIWNVLTNAVKFTPQGGRVDVRLHTGDRAHEIRVTDTGRGIEPEFLPKVFNRFQQADAVHTRSQGGLGLGLAITKQLVELHGGTIRAESAGLGKGATFIIELTLSQMPRDRAPKAPPKPAPKAKTKGKASDVVSKADKRQPLNGTKVLLVEDNPDSSAALITLLTAAGATVRATHSATAAMQALAEALPDVIVSDIAMPGVDGYAFMRQVRTDEAHQRRPQIPAIALSAFSREVDQVRAKDAGFQRHVSKPVDTNQLISTLVELVGVR